LKLFDEFLVWKVAHVNVGTCGSSTLKYDVLHLLNVDVPFPKCIQYARQYADFIFVSHDQKVCGEAGLCEVDAVGYISGVFPGGNDSDHLITDGFRCFFRAGTDVVGAVHTL